MDRAVLTTLFVKAEKGELQGKFLGYVIDEQSIRREPFSLSDLRLAKNVQYIMGSPEDLFTH